MTCLYSNYSYVYLFKASKIFILNIYVCFNVDYAPCYNFSIFCWDNKVLSYLIPLSCFTIILNLKWIGQTIKKSLGIEIFPG